ncbi:hypothetical protein [Campylobacter fetus]|nr:hypothetical protein [Campylobacter fetus]WKW19908.1 hypothetical protein IXZ14_05880 [Campylobacter fetus subsp. venerealis]WKW20606.1 hypothetical protein IXZ14_09745 [Campylobacter fetus subsp. venerealis]WKW21079.1 hypothetical protein IXZ14_01685 [Campylobacter fetus subsp. venerealis]WKW21655.1 hypothetical protein IXZ14_04925 [Campylobacter fetus subsp. venerealis]WKW22705.1 hypothetical protein IXZ22_10085 [Campylobacter fetus subsp. venerealis]
MAKHLRELLKATGTINAVDMYSTSTLRPEVSNKIIKTIIDKSDFFKQGDFG